METDELETQRVESMKGLPNRKEQFWELSVFLFLIVPSMVLSFLAMEQGRLGFRLTAVATILRDLSLVGLILFFLWHNRESIHSIGWNFTDFWQEFILGVMLFFPFFYVAANLQNALRSAGF